ERAGRERVEFRRLAPKRCSMSAGWCSVRIAHAVCVLLGHLLVAAGMLGPVASAVADSLAGFRAGPWFCQQGRERWLDRNVRVIVNAPEHIDPKRPTRLVIYATPNANTIEQTLGCGPAAGLDWHFDIQHVAAQVRRLREVSPGENIVLACVEAEGLSWPAWRRKHPDGATRVRKVVETLRSWLPGKSARVTLAGHSGGGSFLFAFLDAADTIPDEIERFVFLDANYGYSDADKHGDKLLGWLKGDRGRRLVVIAYDDRNVMLNGKLVVGPTGGTFRATERMRDWFTRDFPLAESKAGGFVTHSGLDGRAVFRVHTNPDNKI